MPRAAEAASGTIRTDADEVDLYRVLAHALGLPTEDRYDWLSREDVMAALALACERHGVRPGPRARSFARYADYEASYLSLFEVGLPGPPLPLLESSHHRAVPAQQIVLDCVNFYAVLGLSHRRSTPADHLVTQLEFLAAARFAATAAEDPHVRTGLLRLERDFLHRHLLSWLPASVARIEKLDPPLFPSLLRLTQAFASGRAETLGADPQA
ncbi:MAG TPA: molecular chaperone TorD family protein [Candidatus Saccharimonadales bacterium]|nr:molecular chaperone TorD family protein [Candidatus Saccharimonadales bacterium]